MKKITLLVFTLASLVGFSQNTVTFRVDMNNYNGPAFQQVEVFGTFNSWCGGCAPLSDANNDGIWELQVSALSGSIEFKYTIDTITVQESLTPGSPCTLTSGQFTNRVFNVTKDTILPVVCWESCLDCASTPTNSDVVFQVDMSNYSGTFTNVHLNGEFNNWCGSCAPMQDANNDMIYELMVNIPDGDTTEYKFTVDGFTGQEMFAGGEPCTKTTIDAGGTFINRFYVANGDVTLPAVCWNYCVDCASIGIDENWISDIQVSPNPSNGIFNIQGSLVNQSNIKITVTDIRGSVIYESSKQTDSLNESINLNNVVSGMYLLNITSEFGSTTEKIIVR